MLEHRPRKLLHPLRDGTADPAAVVVAGGRQVRFRDAAGKVVDGRDLAGVCSTGKVDLVRSLGADHVIDYTRTHFVDEVRRYDLVLDIAGVRPVAELRKALTPRGTLVIVGGEGEGRWIGPVGRLLRALALSPFVKHSLRGLFSTENQEDLETLRALVEEGKVTPVIDRTYPLADAAEAIHYVSEGHARGKIVITV